MDNFIVSALKYRPTTFNSVVGQSALTLTLKNAIKSNHLAHAYLFCGPRGVGKTTCARIFAKTINCQNLTSEFEACNECESCKSFNEQRSYNIHELDAASNNSVDDIRTLIDQVRIPPQIGKYSVYIVDEVHMLSTGAFNAFLKTLEEPPSYAIFILATTEKHKIIPTILSRCQIFDFNRITVADTVNHLKYVAEKENVTVDVNGLNVIAQKSDGGMRDALSIFDQLVSFCGNNITYQGVIDNLNVLDFEYYFKLIEAFLSGDVSQSLLIFNDILNKGFDANHFITGLSSHLRDLLVSKDPETIQLLDVGEDIGKRYAQQATICSSEFLFSALKITNDCDLNYRISKNKRLLVELTLIRLSQLVGEKKKQQIAEEPAPALKKIEATPQTENKPQEKVEKEITSTPKQAEVKPILKPKSEPTTLNQPIPTPAPQKKEEKKVPVNNFNRPASISINKKPNEELAKNSSDNSSDNHEVEYNEDFSDEALVSEWKNFGTTITDDIKRVNFQNQNLPVRISNTEFEIQVNNIMQESELNKIQGDITRFLAAKLKNSHIKMSIRILEETEQSKTISPEEKYKLMTQENPMLENLRKNLGMELD